MSQPSALELSLRMVHSRRWGQGYRQGRRTMFTPIAATSSRTPESEAAQDDDTVLYIEHFREQPKLSRNP